MAKRRLTLPVRRILYVLLGQDVRQAVEGKTIFTPNFSLVVTPPAKEEHDYTYTIDTTLKDRGSRAIVDKLCKGVFVVSDITADDYYDYLALIVLRVLRYTLLCGFPPSRKQISSALGFGIENAKVFWNPAAKRCVKQVIINIDDRQQIADCTILIPASLQAKLYAKAATEDITPEELTLRILEQHLN